MSVYGDVPDSPVAESRKCDPLSCYGVGKLASELYLNVYKDDLPFTALRMFNVYGPGQDMTNLRQGMVSIFLSQALSDKHFTVKGSLQRYRDFIFIDDVVQIWFDSAFSSNTLNKIMNVGTGRRTTVDSLLSSIASITGISCVNSSTPTLGDQHGIYADTTLLKSIFPALAFKSLEEGLQTFLHHTASSS